MMGIVIAAVVVIADQLSKLLIQNIASLQDVEVIRDFFYLTYVKNTGAAWSLFSDMTGVLTLISAVAVGVMLWYIITKKPKGLTLVAVALMAGGAAGNMIDRLFLQYVRDFLHFYIFGYDFPVFNIADIALCVGVGLLLLSAFLEEEQK